MRPIYQIANEIWDLWDSSKLGASPAFPYLLAMRRISKIEDKYGLDDGEDIVLRFLSNASSFKGPDAVRLKKELRQHLK